MCKPRLMCLFLLCPPQGAAIEDGTLRIGDRLLEVNGVAVTGNSQSEVAGLLRQIPIGGTATLIVSRQDQRGSEAAPGDPVAEDEKTSSPLLPRQLVRWLRVWSCLCNLIRKVVCHEKYWFVE